MAVVPVVPHDKQRILGNRDGPEVVPRGELAGKHPAVGMDGIVPLHPLSVDVELLGPHLHLIPFDAHNPLDKVLLRVFRIDKHHDVVAFRVLDGDNGLLDKGKLHPVDKLVHQDMVAYLKGVEHGARGDFERLDHEGSNEKGQDEGNDNCLDIFAKGAFGRRGVSRGILFRCQCGFAF